VDVVKDVRQTEINTTEPLVPKPYSEVGIVANDWRNRTSPDVDETSAKLTKADCKTLHSEIHRRMYAFYL
jgi:hypothetical protein